jgi:Na+/melibiose symporter-like transporter
MKLDWRKTFLVGLGFFGISVVWPIYNSFVPIFLQAGRPDFETTKNVLGFGLSETATGVIMGLDNIAALIILPLVGIWSDRIRTRIGRRYPFILGGLPIAAAAFLLIPIAITFLTPETAGSIEKGSFAFSLFMLGAILMLLAMAVMRTPIVSLMPDVTPSELRSKANGVINFMGGAAFIIAQFALSRLFDVSPLAAFGSASLTMVVAILILYSAVKEPDPADLPHPEHEQSDQEQALASLRGFSLVPPQYRRSLLLLLAALFCWVLAYDGISTFFSSYAVDVLKVSPGLAPTLFGLAGLTFIVFAIPAGFIGERIGRRNSILIGLASFSLLLVIAYFVPNMYVIGVILALGGIGWALININSLPMVVDTIDDERFVGTFTGLYYLATQSGSAIAPAIMGYAIQATGSNYATIFLIAPAFFVLAMACMWFVTRGEAHTRP